jgi:hypothetical protein
MGETRAKVEIAWIPELSAGAARLAGVLPVAGPEPIAIVPA